MQVSLVTGNNIYFANGFSSLFIPYHLALGTSEDLSDAKRIFDGKFTRFLEFFPETSKLTFSTEQIIEKNVRAEGFTQALESNQNFLQDLKTLFNQPEPEKSDDSHEEYKWQEYQCFIKHENVPADGFFYTDVSIPDTMKPFLKRIKQIEELKVSQVQLDFTRVRPNERIQVEENKMRPVLNGQDIFSKGRQELTILPANEIFGEGIFIEFDIEAINRWRSDYVEDLEPRVNRLVRDVDDSSNAQGSTLRRKMRTNGIKHTLIHTFSHILMRELEFSCGYPTASLKERLYISPRMSGLLIYTAEGAEGSMGGLVSQGKTDVIENLIKMSLERAVDCSSDPICWESDGQGIFDLNLASCFSCSLVSETACEDRNLLLDRRVLIDPKYGFFRSLLKS